MKGLLIVNVNMLILRLLDELSGIFVSLFLGVLICRIVRFFFGVVLMSFVVKLELLVKVM